MLSKIIEIVFTFFFFHNNMRWEKISARADDKAGYFLIGLNPTRAGMTN